ncbi:MAG: CpaF family protein [Acidobacteriales bacterium]|nr:CpaF family protein [Terriglobales bacterium]
MFTREEPGGSTVEAPARDSAVGYPETPSDLDRERQALQLLHDAVSAAGSPVPRVKGIEELLAKRVQARIDELLYRLLDQRLATQAPVEEETAVAGAPAGRLDLGPLEPLLADPTISDILVTTAHMVYVERNGQLQPTDLQFENDAQLLAVIERIAAQVGRRIDASSPLVDARLPDGSRVNAAIPPVAVDGPVLSIRRFGRSPLTPDGLVEKLTLTEEMMLLLNACIRAKLNMLISGGTGSGKTTLLNALSSFIPETERIVTIEDAAELQLQQRHVVRLESHPADAHGQGAIHIRQLVISALRMRPDRIIVGEVRGEEALDMLQAMNTGHAGSMTTIHANSPRDALSRIEVMAGMANSNLGTRSIRQQMASALDLIVHVARCGDGSRRITHITECLGMEGEIVSLQDVFVFDRIGVTAEGRTKGRFRPTGIRPKLCEKTKVAGIEIPPATFQRIVAV